MIASSAAIMYRKSVESEQTVRATSASAQPSQSKASVMTKMVFNSMLRVARMLTILKLLSLFVPFVISSHASSPLYHIPVALT